LGDLKDGGTVKVERKGEGLEVSTRARQVPMLKLWLVQGLI